jgi:hypothetical protein
MRGPRSRPRKFDLATSTCGSRRMRFAFHVVPPVHTRSRRPSSLATHTGVETALPSLRNVVRLM